MNKLFKITLMRTVEKFVEAETPEAAKRLAISKTPLKDFDDCPSKVIGNGVIVNKYNASKILHEPVISESRDYDAVVEDVVK